MCQCVGDRVWFLRLNLAHQIIAALLKKSLPAWCAGRLSNLGKRLDDPYSGQADWHAY